MRAYLQLLDQILTEGTHKHPSREESGATKNATIGLPNLYFTHDLAEGFPLLTTKKMYFRQTVGELRSFLQGATRLDQFRDNGCTFWDKWASTGRWICDVCENIWSSDDPHACQCSADALRNPRWQAAGDLGPIYGAQWLAHGQLDHVLRCLRERPTDRRMVVSAWRPDEHQVMRLPPCHLMWVLTPYDEKLHLSWLQRSCDFPIGVPHNIASYAILLSVLAKWAGLEPGSISVTFCDAHIYQNQIAGVWTQLERTPFSLPRLDVTFEDPDDFHTWSVELHDYQHHPAISFGEVEV